MGEERKNVCVMVTYEQEKEVAQKQRRAMAYDSTKQISSINRQLAMTGVGVVWMLRMGRTYASNSNILLIALSIFVLGILIDVIVNDINIFF